MRRRLILRWLVRNLLPEAMADRVWRWHTSRKPRSDLATASDHRAITIADGVSLEVFWVDRQLGPGPGASLNVLGHEVMRFDCFGTHGLGGHYHLNPRQTAFYSVRPARLFFPTGSHQDNIERAAFELERNLPAALAMNRDARVRAIALDSGQLPQAADYLRRQMLELLRHHRVELTEGRELRDTLPE